MNAVSQYDIVLVNLDPTIGSEMKKTRPCAVISPNEMNRHLETIIIAPITSTSKPYPTRVQLQNNAASGWVVIDQIRTIDQRRIVKMLGSLSPKEIERIKSVIKEAFVD